MSASTGPPTLWVTRDRGAHVIYAGPVPAGLTAMQALERKLHVSTRYGGRYVQAIDGIQGSLSSEHDWLYFVNGLEANEGATVVRLHPGDIEWWDYRSWSGNALNIPVVVGAYPKPFSGSPTSVVAHGSRRRPSPVRSPGRWEGPFVSSPTAKNSIVIDASLAPLERPHRPTRQGRAPRARSRDRTTARA